MTAGALTPPNVAAEQAFANTTVFHVDTGIVSNYAATVSLGDGTTLSSLTDPDNVQVVADPNGGYDVQLSYTYAQALSNQTFSVTVTNGYGTTVSASTSTFSVAVNSTTTTLQTSPTMVNGQPLTLTATVAGDAPGSGTPQGTVDFVNSTTGAELGTVTLGDVLSALDGSVNPSDPSSASISNLTIPAGTYSITATYNGEANVFGSSSTVLPVGPTTLSISTDISSVPAVSSWYQPVTFTATVANIPGWNTPPTGDVDFFDATTQTDLGDVPLVSGVATLPVDGLGVAVAAAGMQTITANYSGDANFAANSSSTNVTVVNPTTTSLQASPTVALSDQAVTLTATVAVDAPGSGTPGGTVDFSVLNTATNPPQTTDLTPVPVALGTVLSKLDGSMTSTDPSTASISNLTLPPGTYTVTATYSGDADNGGSSAVLGLSPTITTVAGNGISADSGDLGPAQSASIGNGAYGPGYGLAVDAAGDLFIADSANNAIREVNQSGLISTVATGISLRRGNLRGRTDAPEGVAVDSLGNLYIADTGASVVRVVNLTGEPETLPDNTPLPIGGIATIAGTGPVNGFGNGGLNGDGGPATQAQLFSPNALAVDAQGDVFIADSNLDEIREVADPFGTSAVTLPDGNGTLQPGYIGMLAGGAANPQVGVTAFALDGNGNLYFSDIQYTLGELNLSTGQITNVPLTPPAAYAQNNLPGVGGAFGMAVDAAGNVYYADSYNNVVLEYSPSSNTTSIVAGEAGQAGYYPGDNQPAASSLLSFPTGLALAANGAIYVADAGNSRVREVLPASPLQVLNDTSTSDNSLGMDLQKAVGTAPSLTLQAATPDDVPYLIAAINNISLTSSGTTVPVTVTLDLSQGQTGANYPDADIKLQHGVTLVVVGNGSSTIFMGHSPALWVQSGNVVFENVTFTTATDSPTILVTGGSLTLVNDTIDSSTGYSDPAIEVTGGTVDLGTANAPGGNVLNVNGAGSLLSNTTGDPNAVTAVGDTFEVDGQVAPVPTTVTLNASPAVSSLGQPVTFTATVSPEVSNGTPPTGDVDFVDTTTNTDLGDGTLDGNGVAIMTTAQLGGDLPGVGSLTVTAYYQGDDNYAGSTRRRQQHAARHRTNRLCHDDLVAGITDGGNQRPECDLDRHSRRRCPWQRHAQRHGRFLRLEHRHESPSNDRSYPCARGARHRAIEVRR